LKEEMMEQNAVETATLDGSFDASDLSILSLILRADIVVQAVMLMLAFASVWCWAIIFEKVIRIKRVNRRSDKFEDSFWSGGSLEDLFDRIGNNPSDPMSAVFSSAMREWRRGASRSVSNDVLKGGLQERIERVMQVTLGREMERLEKYMTFLASVGSTAPFIGLFGTVWGIMNSFQSIALSKNTSLAVVAPGIAEALFATALGLVAAIPAVLAYNKLSADLNRYANRLENFSHEFSSILSRQLDEGS
jgi:biopolymer transport protein TolQ